jgi:hypothetical protein
VGAVSAVARLTGNLDIVEVHDDTERRLFEPRLTELGGRGSA